jgi:general stress protein 26
MKNNFHKNQLIGFLLIFLSFLSLNGTAQNQPGTYPRDTLLKAAREIIQSTHFCALATIDSTGIPQVRTMNPFPLKDDMVVWFATGRKSRKVKDMRHNPNVCVYYADHVNASGYVTINGKAEVIDDKELLVKMKRDYWEGISNWQDIFVLIKITPVTMDVTNYARGVAGDPETSRAPRVVFKSPVDFITR